MKKLPLLITSILLIGACSDSQETVQSSEPQPMVEYVWMKAGPNFNEDNLSQVINSWNAMIDEMGCTLNANILTPDNNNDGFDFIIKVIDFNTEKNRLIISIKILNIFLPKIVFELII